MRLSIRHTFVVSLSVLGCLGHAHAANALRIAAPRIDLGERIAALSKVLQSAQKKSADLFARADQLNAQLPPLVLIRTEQTHAKQQTTIEVDMGPGWQRQADDEDLLVRHYSLISVGERSATGGFVPSKMWSTPKDGASPRGWADLVARMLAHYPELADVPPASVERAVSAWLPQARAANQQAEKLQAALEKDDKSSNKAQRKAKTNKPNQQ